MHGGIGGLWPWLIPLCLVGTIVPLMVGFALVSVGVAMWRARRMMALVARPTFAPQWAHAAYSLWTGGEDCGTWSYDQARSSLKSWYGVEDSAAFWEVVEGLRTGQTGNIAWDQVRALDLLRIGTAAGYLTQDECWAAVASLGDALRSNYRSWEELGAAFEKGMHNWQDGRGVTDAIQRGRVQRNLPVLRGQVWPHVDWSAPLR